MYVEIHLLQSFVPSNLNRDDTGSPKDCEFGGVRRARISSQCLKRAIRTHPAFAEATRVPLGTRTKRMIKLVRDRLVAASKPQDRAEKIAAAFAEKYASKLDPKTIGPDKETQTAVLLYLAPSEIEAIAQALLAKWDDLASLDEKSLGELMADIARPLIRARREVTSAPDIALFGRMLAEKPELNLDAACQVAHAISTHRVTMEMDFYTAVDDLVEEAAEETGAGMMGVLGYDSACYYRYARIDWKQLVKNLDGDAELALRAVDGFLRATLYAVPSGKQNSHAAFNPPSLALAVVRRDGMAWNLANAFEQPVRADREGGYVGPSLKALDAYWGDLCTAFGVADLLAVAALRCGMKDVDLPNLSAHTVTNEADWRACVLGVLKKGG
ncbi:MAG: type I-E CRISPR-associated protein Cas7/Cse4/CasC [Chloroflexi bacterium]|nr:type I-E CRISPR-associated protein Cas7/Cse4/CasC [Chloroflexota bacterium]